MFDQNKLITDVDEGLKPFKYFAEPNVTIPNVRAIYYVKIKPPLKVRNVCAVIHSPKEGFDNVSGRRFFEFIRKSLLDKYGDAFLWKELEICFIVICDHETYEKIVSENGKIVDQASFSLNAMMGTFFIDQSNGNHFLRSSWGIYFSGEHLKVTNEIIESWCADCKKNHERSE